MFVQTLSDLLKSFHKFLPDFSPGLLVILDLPLVTFTLADLIVHQIPIFLPAGSPAILLSQAPGTPMNRGVYLY